MSDQSTKTSDCIKSALTKYAEDRRWKVWQCEAHTDRSVIPYVLLEVSKLGQASPSLRATVVHDYKFATDEAILSVKMRYHKESVLHGLMSLQEDVSIYSEINPSESGLSASIKNSMDSLLKVFVDKPLKFLQDPGLWHDAPLLALSDDTDPYLKMAAKAVLTGCEDKIIEILQGV